MAARRQRRATPSTPPLVDSAPSLLRRPRSSFTPDLRELVRGFAPMAENPFTSHPPTPALRDLYPSGAINPSPALSHNAFDALGRGSSDDDAMGAAGGGRRDGGGGSGDMSGIAGGMSSGEGTGNGGGSGRGSGGGSGSGIGSVGDIDMNMISGNTSGSGDGGGGGGSSGDGGGDGKDGGVGERSAGSSGGCSKDQVVEGARRSPTRSDKGSNSGSATLPESIESDGGRCSVFSAATSKTRAVSGSPPTEDAVAAAAAAVTGGLRGAVSRESQIASMNALFYPGLAVAPPQANPAAWVPAAPVAPVPAAPAAASGPAIPAVPGVAAVPGIVPAALPPVAAVVPMHGANHFQAAFQMHQNAQMQHLYQMYQAQSMFFLNGGGPLGPFAQPGALPAALGMGAEFGGNSLTSSPDLTYGMAAAANAVAMAAAATAATAAATAAAAGIAKTDITGCPEGADMLALQAKISKDEAVQSAGSPTTPFSSSNVKVEDLDMGSGDSAIGKLPKLDTETLMDEVEGDVENSGNDADMDIKGSCSTTMRAVRSSKQRRQLAVERAGCSAMQAKRNRAAAIERLRAKKRLRTFNFKVRYACRKKIAMVRPRINGRFATKEEVAESKRTGIPLS